MKYDFALNQRPYDGLNIELVDVDKKKGAEAMNKDSGDQFEK